MPLRVIRSAAPCIVVLAVVGASRPVFAQEEAGQPVVTAQTPVILWGSAADASGTQLSAATFEIPAGTHCHVAEAQEPVALWSCTLGESTVSGFARRAAFTKRGAQRAEPKSAFWERLQLYSSEWLKCMQQNAPPGGCSKALGLRLNLFWAARLAEAPVSGVQTIRCPLNFGNPACVGNVCESECFSEHLGEGQLIGELDGSVFLQREGKDTLRMFVATSQFDDSGTAKKTIAPPMSLFDPMLVSMIRTVEGIESLRIGVDLDRHKGTFLEVGERSARFRTRLRLDGHRPFVVCDRQIVRPELARPARIVFEERTYSNLFVPIHEYALPCASSLVIGDQVPGIRAGAKSADRFGTPPRVTTGPDGNSLSVGALRLRGEPAWMAGMLSNCTVELGDLSEGSYHSCSAVYAGDLNGDGKEDFVLDLRGESGCGGTTLFLSTPTGWKRVAGNSDYC